MTGLTLNRVLGLAVAVMLAFIAMPPGQGRADDSPRLTVLGDTTLEQDLTGPVVIASDGVTLDCAGHQIKGDGYGRGVVVIGRTGVTVKNCDVSNFATGFFIAGSSASDFTDNSSHHNRRPADAWLLGSGFWVQNSSGNVFSGNAVYENAIDGFVLWYGVTGNSFANNYAATNGGPGFFVGERSGGNSFVANTAADNNHAGFFIASSDNALTQNIAQDNALDGFLIDGGYRGGSHNSLTENVAQANARAGFLLIDGASMNTLRQNSASDNLVGFALLGATSNLLTENSACDNTVFDAFQDEASTGNVWNANTFCTSAGI